MGQRVPAYRFPERARRTVACRALRPFKAAATGIIFYGSSIRRDPIPLCYDCNGYLGRPILDKYMGPLFRAEIHWNS